MIGPSTVGDAAARCKDMTPAATQAQIVMPKARDWTRLRPVPRVERLAIATTTVGSTLDHFRPGFDSEEPLTTAGASGSLRGINEAQRIAAEEIYADPDGWDFHYTDEPTVRYLRDRRLRLALRLLRGIDGLDLERSTVLVVCGGVGGEAVFLRRHGVGKITVSDLSANALAICHANTPEFDTLLADAEDMSAVPDASFDVVLVQDGLHHLAQPAKGLTEMLRVARRAVVVIEPHVGVAARLMGTTWERHGDAVNYVFRWNRVMLEQVANSYLLQPRAQIDARRLWDHGLVVHRAVSATRLPGRLQLRAARVVYGLLRPFGFVGNAMVGVVVKTREPLANRQAPTWMPLADSLFCQIVRSPCSGA